MDKVSLVTIRIPMLKKIARDAVKKALAFDHTHHKLVRAGGQPELVSEFKQLSIQAWQDVEELHDELDMYIERVKLIEDELEYRIYDI